MTNKYTLEDIIINPNDPRVKIGKEYYFSDSLIQCLNNANADGPSRELVEVRSDNIHPFHIKDYVNVQCIIRKKEPKCVPFDLSKEEDRAKVIGAWIRRKDRPNIERLITGIENNYIDAEGYCLDAEALLERYEFVDGTPCGKLVVEE